MCYTIEIPDKPELHQFIDRYLDNAIRNDEWNEYFERLSGFTHDKIPVLTSQNPKAVQSFNWGLIPSWTKTEQQAMEMRRNTLNAKSETIFEKPSFKESIGTKRCLIFVKGFYEWREYAKNKYPYYISVKNHSVFALGGIYESWLNPASGEVLNTTSIITTAANPLMENIHNVKKRMPFILPDSQLKDWLNPTISQENMKELMIPFPEQQMEAHTISKLINSKEYKKNDGKLKAYHHYPELPPLGQDSNQMSLF